MYLEKTEYDPAEQEEIQTVFRQLAWPVLADGGRKRRASQKPHWMEDPDHLPALHRHLIRYDRGEVIDKDSGTHAMVHVGVRAFMVAAQELATMEGSGLIIPAAAGRDWC